MTYVYLKFSNIVVFFKSGKTEKKCGWRTERFSIRNNDSILGRNAGERFLPNWPIHKEPELTGE
jgi:hypothetical protein